MMTSQKHFRLVISMIYVLQNRSKASVPSVERQKAQHTKTMKHAPARLLLLLLLLLHCHCRRRSPRSISMGRGSAQSSTVITATTGRRLARPCSPATAAPDSTAAAAHPLSSILVRCVRTLASAATRKHGARAGGLAYSCARACAVGRSRSGGDEGGGGGVFSSSGAHFLPLLRDRN